MSYEFQRANLRGADFKGKELTNANFSHVDIRGTDFTNAVLVGANFRNARAGLPTFRAIGLVAFLLFISLFAGLISGYAGACISDLFYSGLYGHAFFGVISLITLAIFLIVLFWQGLGATLAILVAVVVTCLIAATAVFKEDQAGISLGLAAEFTALGLTGAIASVGNMALAIAIARVMTLPKARVVAGFTALIGAALGVLLGVKSQESAWFIAGFVALVSITSGVYVGWQAIAENTKYGITHALAINIVTKGGTSFRGANLTNADFTQATLKSVDFRKAILIRTCFFEVQKLDNARLEGTYLENLKVRRLVITKDGREQNFDHLNLHGLNLKDANLQDSSFINTDLSAATLQNANLFGAKLTQTQLYQTILTEACLTGAYIENWGISTDTRLDGIKCEYIYMRLPTKDDPDPCRKPDNRQETFKEGDFADFIAPIIKTLDLYHTQNLDPRKLANKFKTLDLFHYEGIDPTAAAIAVTQLANNHPDAELQIVALEGRGQEKIRLQAIVSGDANPSQLSHEYSQTYSQIKSLPYSDLQALLIGIKEKDERIHSLENLLSNAIRQPKFYVETEQNEAANQIKILFLASDPSDAARLRLGKELRDIQTQLQLAKYREKFALEERLSQRPGDISQAILDVEPQIIHFSGHGTSNGELCFENDLGKIQPVKPEALAALFALVSQQVKCVVLNACYSETQAKAIAEHIRFVIGMNQTIGDKAAIAFAVGFYKALGANRSIEQAYQFGCAEIQLQGIPEHLTPIIYTGRK